MSQVHTAIQGDRCSLAVSEALLRDAEVALALKQRAALAPMALAGPAVSPVVLISAPGLAKAIGERDGLLIIVEPTEADLTGLQKLAEMLRTAANKPTILFVARTFDALRMQMLFRGFRVDHLKERGKVFITTLPMPPADAASAQPSAEADSSARAAKAMAKAARKPTEVAGPRFVFVGRDEEVESLAGMLGQGGPIVVSGSSGIGKTAIIEHAIEKAGLRRLPDLALGRGMGADALLARIATITRAGGSDALYEVLKRPHGPIEVVEAAITSLTAASGCDGQVMVIEGLHMVAGRQGDFFRKSRVELLCEALLVNRYPLRLVFTSLVQPVFYREGRDQHLRRMVVGGIKGRFYFDIFQAMGAPDFSRDKFGPLAEKLHGHCLAVRTAAVAIRHNEALIDDERFFKMESADDVEVVRKQIERRLEKLAPEPRALLARLAHLRVPIEGSTVADLEISRKDRSYLVSEGLLDMVGTETSKRYAVHSVVRQALTLREISDFDTFAELGRRLSKEAAAADGVQRLALQQEANRCFVEARLFRDLVEGELPDFDSIVESVIGLVRSKVPRFDMAAQRLAELLRRDPGNADAHLLKIELLRRQDTKGDALAQAIQDALDQAPVPEVYHEAVGFFLARNARNKAIKVLEGAVVALPDHSRLRTRLAALLLRQGRRPEAIEQLRLAMDLDPMLPDAYGLLGMARREEGAERLDEAENLLREAVRLAPHDVVQTSRLVWLLLDIARGVPERTVAVRAEIRALLDALLIHDKKSWEAQLLYAVALREEGGQNDRARWFLKQARRLAPPSKGPSLLRFDVEEAMLELAEGRIDDAELRLRKLGRKDPTNHRIFGALARVLEARGQLVAAHMELVRAADRTAPNSLDRQAYDVELARLRACIEAGAGVLPDLTGSAEPPAEGSAEASAEPQAETAAPADEAADEGPAVEEAAGPADEEHEGGMEEAERPAQDSGVDWDS